ALCALPFALLLAVQLEGAELVDWSATNITRSCDCPVFPGEELTIHFSERIDGRLDQSAQVSSNGILRLPLNQSLAISNQSEAQLAAQIQNTFARLIQTQTPLLVGVAPANPFFSIVGGVKMAPAGTNSPLKCSISEEMTVL